MNQTPKIAIIILNWNGLSDTLACLDSVQKITYPSFETIVVDNGSTDGSIDSLRRHFPKITLIENQHNLGFAEGNNVGLRYALGTDAAYFFLLNNDTLVDPQILHAFIDTFATHPEAGILGSKIYLYNTENLLDHMGGMWNKKTARFDLIGNRAIDNQLRWESPEKIDYVCGASLIASRAVFEHTGLLASDFFLIWEEADLCFRARRQGFETLTCPQAKIWHKVSASFVGKPHSTYFWWRNRLLWIERNCSKKDKIKIWTTILIPEILHMVKIRGLKTLQLNLEKRLYPHKDFAQKQEKLLKNKAALQGILDYVHRKFGNGPAWLFTSAKK